MSRYTGLDWAAMMRAGMPGLGLSPQEFWRLSPAELLLMLGETGPAPMQRSAFDALGGAVSGSGQDFIERRPAMTGRGRRVRRDGG
jgi:uncharacterized phage protein (TIGR02216 family)